MWNSISSKKQFCALKPQRYNGAPEHCSFQAKLALSSERSHCCCHAKLRHSHSSLQTWSQRAQLFPLSTTPNQAQFHQVPYDYAVTNLGNLRKNSVLKRCLGYLPPIMEDTTAHGGGSSLQTGGWFILSAGPWRMKPRWNNRRDPQGWKQPAPRQANPQAEEAVSHPRQSYPAHAYGTKVFWVSFIQKTNTVPYLAALTIPLYSSCLNDNWK